jgi:uncharacterized protein YciI
MPLFAILCHDRTDAGSLRADTRPRHLAYLEEIEGQMLAAGPFLDEAGAPKGSLIIADFADLAAANAFAQADPYAVAGLFRAVDVSAWRQVFPR